MMENDRKPDTVTLTDAQRKSRRNRSIALGLALAAFVVVMYIVTLVKMGPDVLQRPL